MWKFLRYLAYQVLILVLFIVGTGLWGPLPAVVVAVAIPLAIEFIIRRYEKQHA